MRGHRDLRLAALVAAICAIGVLITPLGPVRLLFAIPLALFLPGYGVGTAALAPRRIESAQLLPLGLGLSLATLAVGTILLNFTPGGLQALPWALLLLVITVGGCLIAAHRRGTVVDSRAIRIRRPNATTAIVLGGALVMAAAAVAIAQISVEADDAFGYTELWMAPGRQSPSDAQIGVKSELQNNADFRLELKFGDRRAPSTRSFELEPGETRTFDFPHAASAAPVPVRVKLYRRANPTAVYRVVFGWLPAQAS